MALYDKAKIVSMTRFSLGMSKEELCRGICSVRTLSRLESGCTRVKNDTFRLLMKRMNRSVFHDSIIQNSSSPGWFDLQEKCDNAVSRYNYEEVRQLIETHRNIVPVEKSDIQYLKVEEALFKYESGDIEASEKYDQLDQAIRMTAPHYEQYLGSVFPYTLRECRYFMILGNTCDSLRPRDCGQALALYQMALRCINAGYMCGPDVDRLKFTLLYDYCYVLTDDLRYEESIRSAKELIEAGLQSDCGNPITDSMCEISWIYKQLKDTDRRFVTEEERKRHIRKIVYLCMATGNTFAEDRMRTRNSDAWD